MKRWYLLCLPDGHSARRLCGALDPDMPHDRGRAVGQHSHCPPGQERKGNCTPGREDSFLRDISRDGRSIER